MLHIRSVTKLNDPMIVLSSTMGWSNMLPEVLNVIARKHIVFYEDYPSFAGVCKSWHSAALQAVKGNKPPSHFPSLMLSEKIGDEEFRELFLLSNKTICKIRLPEVYGKLCMSSCGWLITVADDHSSQLINPLSRKIFNLPKIDTVPGFVETSVLHNSISKLLFLAHSSLVVVVWGSGELGFCCVGDNKWTTFDDDGWDGKIMDITYYNGRVYAYDCNYYIGAWDVYGEDPNQIVDVTRMPLNEVDAYADGDLGGAYILGLDDGDRKRLLVVIRKGVADNNVVESGVIGYHVVDYDDDSLGGVFYETESFQVWGYDLGTGKWSRVKDLGTKSLFVGHSSSFWVEQDTTGAIKGNCIYFTDDVFESYRASENGGGRDMGIYHLSNGVIEPHFTGESRSLLTPPIWLQSM